MLEVGHFPTLDQLQSPGLAQLGSVCSVTNLWVPTAADWQYCLAQCFRLAPHVVKMITGHCPGTANQFVPQLS